jgi:hypothetical protein
MAPIILANKFSASFVLPADLHHFNVPQIASIVYNSLAFHKESTNAKNIFLIENKILNSI